MHNPNSHLATYALMRQIVSAPGYPLLQAFQTDFTKHDQAYLESTWAPDNEYLWVVRENGTELIRLGVHRKINEWGKAALQQGGAMDIFHIKSGTLTKIDDAQAKALIDETKLYRIHDGAVYRPEERQPFARAAVLTYWDGATQQHVGDVMVQLEDDVTLGDVTALRQIAHALLVERAQTFFISAKAVTVNGFDINELINGIRTSPVNAGLNANGDVVFRVPERTLVSTYRPRPR